MIKQTPRGTRYLTAPECQVIASTKINPAFFSGETDGFVRALFPTELNPERRETWDQSAEYFKDQPKLTEGAQLIKFAGQLCYLSFGEQRSKNAQAREYLSHIKQSGHGSVLEHYNVSVLLYGVSRAFTHELVRHRAGFGFSQVSQRYVAGKHLRFVESLATQFEDKPLDYDIQTDAGKAIARARVNQAELHYGFERWIDAAVDEYARRERLLLVQAGIDAAQATTEQRKAVRQEARRCLPNETEAAIAVTGNLRAWRHFVEQRCSKWADAEACRAAHAVFVQLQALEPILWEDYVPGEPRTDGLPTLTTSYRKV